MIIVDTAIQKRLAAGRPIRVAMTGAGYSAKHVASQIISSFPIIHLVVIANRTLAADFPVGGVILAGTSGLVRLGASDQGTQPLDQTSRRAYDLLAEGFGPGFNGELPREDSAEADLWERTTLCSDLSQRDARSHDGVEQDRSPVAPCRVEAHPSTLLRALRSIHTGRERARLRESLDLCLHLYWP